MTTIQEMRRTLHEQKNKLGLVSGSINLVEYDEAEKNVSAHISPQGWDIEISLKKGFNPVQDSRQKAYARKKKISDGLETLVTHVALHEHAHWQLPYGSELGCPYDTYHLDKILEAVTKALPKDKQSQASYVANAFEDMIINPRCREFNEDFSGQVMFWDNEGVSCKASGQTAFTPFYEAFVKLNLHLFGDNSDTALVKRHYAKSKKVDEAVEKVIRELNLPKNIPDSSDLFDKKRWPDMAARFAKILAPLLEQTPTERLSAYSSPDDGSQQGQKNPKPSPGNGIEEKMKTGEGKEDVSYGRYSSKDAQSPHFTSYEQLDSLYRRLARAIPVKVEAMTKEQSLQISPLTFRPFDEETDDPSRVKASKLFFTDQGIQLAYPNQPLTVTAKAKIQRKTFPDFKLVVLDNSGSMSKSIRGSDDVGSTSFIPWGDKSRYHYALLGFYGIENFLQRQGIAQYIGHGISLFSNSTRYTEGQFSDIDRVRKAALAPEWGNTNLDASVLSESLKGRESFVLSISDGEIANWDSERNTFRKLAENNHYGHIQIGGRTEFTEDLKSWRLPVFYVTSGDSLSKLMVDLAKDTYKRFTRT